jgi:hypothetical protein
LNSRSRIRNRWIFPLCGKKIFGPFCRHHREQRADHHNLTGMDNGGILGVLSVVQPTTSLVSSDKVMPFMHDLPAIFRENTFDAEVMENEVHPPASGSSPNPGRSQGLE